MSDEGVREKNTSDKKTEMKRNRVQQRSRHREAQFTMCCMANGRGIRVGNRRNLVQASAEISVFFLLLCRRFADTTALFFAICAWAQQIS